MAMSPTDGINFSGTNSGRSNQNIRDRGANLRHEFAGHVAKATAEGQGIGTFLLRYGRETGEPNPYMDLSEPTQHGAPVGPGTTPPPVVAQGDTKPSDPKPSDPNGVVGQSVNVFHTEGVGS